MDVDEEDNNADDYIADIAVVGYLDLYSVDGGGNVDDVVEGNDVVEGVDVLERDNVLEHNDVLERDDVLEHDDVLERDDAFEPYDVDNDRDFRDENVHIYIQGELVNFGFFNPGNNAVGVRNEGNRLENENENQNENEDDNEELTDGSDDASFELALDVAPGEPEPVTDEDEDYHLRGAHILGEIVDEEESDPPIEREIGSHVIHFDTNLPVEHSYLGPNMNRVSGVDYLEAGRIHRLMLFLHQHIVYPGEVIPLMFPNYIINNDIDTENGLLFGVAFAHVSCPSTGALYGVTCQVYEKGNDERGNTLIKSRALQRFITTDGTRREQLEYITSGAQLKTFGYVKILPEIHLPDPLTSMPLGSMSRFRGIPRLERYLTNLQANSIVWPKYLYDQYNFKKIIEKAATTLEPHKVDSIPSDPVRLSFWLSRNSYFSEEQLKKIFITDSVNIRLKMIANSFTTEGIFVCRFCRNQIALCRDLFAMSKHGVQSQYCNSAGYIHETNTVYKVFNNAVSFSGEPSSEFSWFPGYEWRITLCKLCNRHIGWQFRTNVKNLTPTLFYGITGASVRIDEEHNRRVVRHNLFSNAVRYVDSR